MIRKSSTISQNIYVSILLILALYTQLGFMRLDSSNFTIYVSVGFALGFTQSFGKKVFLGIFLSTFLFSFFYDYSISGNTVESALLLAISLSTVNLLIPVLFMGVSKLLKVDIPSNVRKSFLYITANVITVAIFSILPALQKSIYLETSFGSEYYLVFYPILVGTLVFGTAIKMSNTFDSYLNKSNVLNSKDIAFVLVYVSVIYAMFSDVGNIFGFEQFGYLIVLLFMLNAFLFNYRMLIFISWVYALLYNILYTSVGHHYTVLNMYLVILIIITIYTKNLIEEIRRNNEDLVDTKQMYEDMLNSTLELMNIKDNISLDDSKYSEDNLKNIFNISSKIFHNFEYGLCVVRDDDFVKVLDAKGHDLTMYKNAKLNSRVFNWSNFTPSKSFDLNDKIKLALGERYDLFKKEIPKIKESVSIVIQLSDTERGAITFDILEGSELTFTETDMYNIRAFQNLINSYYEMNELSTKNSNLKDDIVLSLIRTLELYDQYTGGHSTDVAFLSGELCKELKVPAQYAYDVYWAAIVHDIGKIGINSSIINKTSKLTLDEYKNVQQHPIFGYEILRKSQDLRKIARLVKHHHEWYNGSGYPDGLQKDEIPFGSQILQVADSVSSMATSRPYQKAKSFPEIIDELELYKGTQFNPEIANKMIDLLHKRYVIDYFKEQKI